MDRQAERHPPLEPGGNQGNERAVDGVDLDCLGAVDFSPRRFEELRDVLVGVDGHSRRQLRRLVQPRGVRRADVDPVLQRARQVANRDRRIVRIAQPCENSMPSVYSSA